MSRIHLKPIQVLLLHRQALVRAALAAIIAEHIDLDVVGDAAEFGDVEGDQVWKIADVALVAQDLLGPAPYGKIASLQKTHPDLRIVALCQDESIEQQAAAIAAGARGLVGLGTPGRSLCEALRSVARGLRWMDASLERYLGRREPEASPAFEFSLLTPREKQVAALVAQGASYQRIAAQLSISGHTVKNHVRHIFDKLDVNSRVELAVLAVGAID